MSTSFSNKGNVEFIPIKQNTLRQKCSQTHEKK